MKYLMMGVICVHIEKIAEINVTAKEDSIYIMKLLLEIKKEEVKLMENMINKLEES